MAPERLILASRSPQRRAILEQLGVRFTVVTPDGVEELTEGDPRELVVENALRKARAVAERRQAEGLPGEPVLGVDTAVVLDGRAYGKPRDQAEAEGFLSALSGREHEVMSGIALRRGGEERSDSEVTRVRFRELGDREIAWYLATGEWRERAGGYAIQGRGAALVAGVEGDYLNVVGLPAPALLRLAPDVVFAGVS